MSRSEAANQRCFCDEFFHTSTLPQRSSTILMIDSIQWVVLKLIPSNGKTPKR